jgi:hypothetical protein
MHWSHDDGARRNHRQETGTDGRCAKRLPGPPIADGTAIEPTTKSESDSHTKGKATPIRGPPVPPAWYSVREFCLAHRLSISMYFKLKAQGRGPRETAVGSRRYITFEDAAKWRAQQQEVGWRIV